MPATFDVLCHRLPTTTGPSSRRRQVSVPGSHSSAWLKSLRYSITADGRGATVKVRVTVVMASSCRGPQGVRALSREPAGRCSWSDVGPLRDESRSARPRRLSHLDRESEHLTRVHLEVDGGIACDGLGSGRI